MRKKGRRRKRCFCLLFFWGGIDVIDMIDMIDLIDLIERGRGYKKIDCLVVFGDEITLLLM